MPTIAIVGDACRQKPMKWSRQVFNNAFHYLDGVALVDIPVEERHLVSGGAGGADHLAVSLFLSGLAKSLTIHLPAQWIPVPGDPDHRGPVPGFFDTGVRDFKINAGGTCNHYHSVFSKALNAPVFTSLQGLDKALNAGATFIHTPVKPGESALHARNLDVGKVDLLFALTWGPGPLPASNGTLHTWVHSPAASKTHIDLHRFRSDYG